MLSISKIIAQKGQSPLTVLTAYDVHTANILEQSGIDLILVGDSMGTAFKGEKNTLNVTVDEIIHHGKAVRRGAPNTFIICDMPFLSYGVSVEESVYNAGRIVQETGCNAVKLEGGLKFTETIEAIGTIGIPVMGHLGVKPQSVLKEGYKVAGKTELSRRKLIEDALALQEAGVFAIVLEVTDENAAREVTESIKVPTIGIGAGRYTDGQVLVITDVLGLDPEKNYKHNKTYLDGYGLIKSAVESYINEVKDKQFPGEENVFRSEES